MLHRPFKVVSLSFLSIIRRDYLEKTSALVDSSKNALSSSPPAAAPVAPARTDLISQEAYVTETSGQTAHGPEPVLEASAAPGASSKTSKGGPINAIRNFFSRIFRFQRHEDRQTKSNAEVAAVQVTETVTTTTVATSNPPNPSS